MPINDLIPYTANGHSGTAKILIADLPDGRSLIICADENEDDDAGVNQVVETLRDAVCKKHNLDPVNVVWVEYTSEPIKASGGQLGGWELVTFDPRTGKPAWSQMTDEHWRQLGTEPPPTPVPQQLFHPRL